MLIQILIVAFAIFAVVRAFFRFRQGRLPLVWFGFWAFFWVIASVVTLLPQTTTVAARLVGVGRGADFVLYLSVIALFYLIFRLFVKIEDLELEITRLVRKLALEESEKE